MSQDTDQYTEQDPQQQFGQPDTEGKQIPAVGDPGSTTDQMDAQPDHGEESYRGSGRLTGKKALITGGDSGIGRAVSIAFAREGADVVIAYLPDEEEDAQTTVAHIEKAGRRALTVPADLTSEEQCRKLIDAADGEFGRIDILVNNAAYQMAQPGGIEDISTEQFDRVLKTNLYAMFWLCKMALPHMQPGSSIINTSSIQSSKPSPELLDYATSKAAIVNFTRGLAQSLASQGIRVNTVAPGPIWTPLIPSTMPAEKVKTFGSQVPMKRPGQPCELAPVYVMLASAEASYVSGATIAVTGGKPII